MREQEKPFYIAKLEDMTVAAARQQAKIWCDALHQGMRWDNGDPMQGAFHSVLTKDIREQIKPEHIDELEKLITEATLSQEPQDEYEKKYEERILKTGALGYGRTRISVDYHPSGALRHALDKMGAKEKGPSIGGKLELIIPCKSDTVINSCGITKRFGYGAPHEGAWTTLKQEDAESYKVINRFLYNGWSRGARWDHEPEEGVGDLVWVQLSKDRVEPVIQVWKFLGYVHTERLFTVYDDWSGGCEVNLASDAKDVLQPGYLALAQVR